MFVCESLDYFFSGGVVYPIILRILFAKVGFAWGVRVSGLVTTVMGIAATVMVTSLFGQRRTGPYFDIKTIADAQFGLLALGSSFIALSEP